MCDRYRAGAVAGSRFDAAVSFAINGEPANWRRTMIWKMTLHKGRAAVRAVGLSGRRWAIALTIVRKARQ